MAKKILSYSLCCCLVLVGILLQSDNVAYSSQESRAVLSESEIVITYRGRKYNFSERVLILNGVTMHPLRRCIEAINGKVEWNSNTKTAKASLGSNSIGFTVNSASYTANGKRMQISKGVSAYIFKDALYVPIEYAAETLGFTVDTTIKRKTQADSNASTSRNEWYVMKNNEHKPPRVADNIDLEKYNTYYIGDTSSKKVYLTFSLGYENGYTKTFLDALKENNITAAFFLVGDYIKENPDLVNRMVTDGHVVGSHSYSHPDMAAISNERIVSEIIQTEECFKETTGVELPRFFRPPSGYYTERVLDIANQLDYTTVFWSVSYADWDVNNQPGAAAAYKRVMDNIHNGCIINLHTVSKSNAEAIRDIIKSLLNQGYTFGSLYDFV